MVRRESELTKPGAIERQQAADNDPPLRNVIERYVASNERDIGRTKSQVLRSIKSYPIADIRCSRIGSAELVSFAQSISRQVQQLARTYLESP